MKGKLRNNFPNTGREVSMNFITSQVTGIEIGNEHQLPMFWEMKQEVFIFFPLTEKENKNQNAFPAGKLFGIYTNV